MASIFSIKYEARFYLRECREGRAMAGLRRDEVWKICCGEWESELMREV